MILEEVKHFDLFRMYLQQPRPREGLAADVALVVEVVGEHVHAEGRHAHVHLVADLALLRVPRVERPVGLAVSGQVRGCCIVLPAFGTGILRLRLPAVTGRIKRQLVRKFGFNKISKKTCQRNAKH